MASLVWLFWPESWAEFPLNPEALFGFLVAFSTWIYHEFTEWGVSETSPNALPKEVITLHDTQIIQSFLDFFDSSLERQLRENGFASYLRTEYLEKIESAARTWAGNRWEMNSEVLNSAFSDVKHRNTELARLLTENFEYLDHNGTLCRLIVSNSERASDFYNKETFERIEVIDCSATRLLQSCEGFITAIKENVPEVSIIGAKQT